MYQQIHLVSIEFPALRDCRAKKVLAAQLQAHVIIYNCKSTESCFTSQVVSCSNGMVEQKLSLTKAYSIYVIS